MVKNVYFTLPFTAWHCTRNHTWRALEKGGLYTCIKCEVPEDKEKWSQGSRQTCFISLLCLQGSTGTWQLDQVVVWSLAAEGENSAWINCLTDHLTSPETAASIKFHESVTRKLTMRPTTLAKIYFKPSRVVKLI